MINKLKIGTLALLFASSAIIAQTIEEGKKMFTYDKFETAKQIFQNNSTPEGIYWLGQTLLNQRVPKTEVRKLYENGFQENPKSDLLQIAISQIDLLEGKITDAKNIQTSILSKTKDIELYNAVARAQLSIKNGDMNFVIEQLKKASEFNKKKNTELPILLAKAYLQKSNTSDATYALTTALEYDPNNVNALYTRAKMYNFKADATNESRYLEYMNKTIQKDPNFAPAYYDLFYLYFPKDKNKALGYFKKYEQLADKTPELEYVTTNVSFNVGDYDKAITESQKVITRDGEKTDSRYYKVLAHSYLDTNNLADASKYLNLYLSKVNKDEINYGDYLEAAKIALKLNDETTFKSMLDNAYDLTKNNGERYNVAQVAIPIYREKFETNKSNTDTNIPLAYRTELAKWLEINYVNHHDPSNVDLYNFGIENFYIKNWYKTEEAFTKYEEKYPNQIQGFYFVAIANSKVGLNNKSKAIDNFSKAIEIGIKDPQENKYFLNQSLLALAEYAREDNAPDKIKEYATKILSYDSENPQAKALMQ